MKEVAPEAGMSDRKPEEPTPAPASAGPPAARPPPLDAVVKYYEDRAPEELPPARVERAGHPLPVRFAPAETPGPPAPSTPAVSNVQLVHLFDDRRLDVLACDMRSGLVMVLSP